MGHWGGSGDPPPPPTVADSKFYVISGQHLSRAVLLKAEELRRAHLPVPPTLTHVTATVLPRRTGRVGGDGWM